MREDILKAFVEECINDLSQYTCVSPEEDEQLYQKLREVESFLDVREILAVEKDFIDDETLFRNLVAAIAEVA